MFKRTGKNFWAFVFIIYWRLTWLCKVPASQTGLETSQRDVPLASVVSAHKLLFGTMTSEDLFFFPVWLLSPMFQVRSLWRSSLMGPRRTHGSWSNSNWTWGPAIGSWSSSRRRNPDLWCAICLVLSLPPTSVYVNASERDRLQIVHE